MRHSYIDRYADLNSFIHRIDPRIKIISFFIFIFFIVSTGPTQYMSFLIYGLVLFFLMVISNVPFSFIFKKSLVVIPFVVLIAIFMPFIKGGEGVIIFWNVVIKSYLSILTMILLTTTTKFSDLLKGMEKLKLPKIFIMIISFMYRYSFLLIDEVQRMQRATDSRSFGRDRTMRIIKILSNIVGVLFIRSYERAERVYLAMCSRGFKGEIKTTNDFKIKAKDILFLVSMVIALSLIRFV